AVLAARRRPLLALRRLARADRDLPVADPEVEVARRLGARPRPPRVAAVPGVPRRAAVAGDLDHLPDAAVGERGQRRAVEDHAPVEARHHPLEPDRARGRVDLRLFLPRPGARGPHLLPPAERTVVVKQALPATAVDVGPRLAHRAAAEDRRDV